MEKLITLVFRDRTDEYLMRITLKRFTKQHAHKFKSSEFSLAFKTKSYVSKGHLGNNQTRVLTQLQERIKSFESKFAVAFTHV